MNDFKRLANILRSLGATKDAEAVERIPTEVSGIKLSQIFYDPDAPEGGFYDVTEKIRNFAPATDQEKRWHADKQLIPPGSRQRMKGYFNVKDKKVREERERMYPPEERWDDRVFDDFGGESNFGDVPLFRPLPAMIEGTRGMKGHEMPDMPGTFITDIDPGHPSYQDEKGKTRYEDEFELGLPDERIGTFSLDEGYRYKDLENTDPRIVAEAHKVWTNSALTYAQDVSKTAGALNKNLEDWIPTPENPVPKYFSLLSRQFLNNVNMALAGNLDGNYAGERGGTVLGAIDRRLDNLRGMKEAYLDKRENAGPLDERLKEVMSDYISDVSRGPGGSPQQIKEWFEKLKVVYAGSIKLMILDPLGLSSVYPDALKKVLGIHNAVLGKPSLPQWRTRAEGGPTPRELISRPWDKVTMEAPERKKEFEDVATFTGPMTSDITGPYDKLREEGVVSPSVMGQMDAVLASVDFEGKKLEALKEAAENLIAARNNGGLEEMNAAVLDFFLKAGQLYGSTGIVTKNDAINMSFGIGDDSKMEIFIKAMFIGKAWQAYTHMLAEEKGTDLAARQFEQGLDTDLETDREAVLKSIFGERYG